MKLLRTYASIIPAAIAIINAFVALIVAEFFKDDLLAKIVLVVSAGLLGVLAIAATIYNQRRIETDQAEARKKRTRDRDRLGQFLAHGQLLMAQCGNTDEPCPGAEAEAWATETEDFLGGHLGQAYIARFRSGAGLPLTANAIADLQRRNLWGAIYVRVARLEQFSAEIPS
jgi:hypothetical protein